MQPKRVLVTGGAGFVGANLAIRFKEHGASQVVAFDNLKRRGSELNLTRLKAAGVEFLHGDVRCAEDVAGWPAFDLLVDCSAEPSVQAGVSDSPLPVLQNNLVGTIQCMEAARRQEAAFLFLSTSRVYPIDRLNALDHVERETRFDWTGQDSLPGFSAAGVGEAFPLAGPRSLYGATKLASELLLQEYAFNYKMPVMINRCGILTGPWQMGKVDQGVVTLWTARHIFGRPLQYTGFGGSGKQVRDMLHVDDLFSLVTRQVERLSDWRGQVYNVGGSREISFSLFELTEICREATGQKIEIAPRPETSSVDLRLYITDPSHVCEDFGWTPQKSVAQTVTEIARWVRDNETTLSSILA